MTLSLSERLDLCEKFNERTELSDAVSSLLCGVRTLLGINEDHCAQLVLIAAEKCISDYIYYIMYDCWDFEKYNEIDDNVFKYFTGRANKLTEDQYYNLIEGN